MASVTLKDFTGRWQLFLLALHLSVSLVLGADPVTSTNVMSSSSEASTNPAAASTPSPVPTQTSITITAAMAVTPAPQSTSVGAPASGTPGQTSTLAKPTGAGPSVSTATMAASTSTGDASTPISSSSSSVTSMNSSMSTSSAANTTGSALNGTTAWSNTSMSTISCPSFMCNYSDCYSMYKSQNATKCASGYNNCQLTRQTAMCHTVSCSASCSMSCVNASQSNCSVNCCNSTGCLNETFASMMMTTTSPVTTTMTSTTTSATTTTTTTAATTPAGKKCYSGQCNGTDCYKSFNSHLACTSSQPHCQLKKETVGTNVQWTAGCTTNCSGQTSCKTPTTQPPCHLECCNATLTSCLFLNGTLNVPNFATRGPQLHFELVTSVLCLFAMSLIL